MTATVNWQVKVAKPGHFRPTLHISCENGSAGSKVALTAGGSRVEFVVDGTGTWYEYTKLELDPITLTAGDHTIVLKPMTNPKLAVMNIQSVTLAPVE
ncbi:MAG: hypothetical protein ACR2NU_05395 [Aeoliella sp.]